MFFSTTDARGIITAGNEVFTRISGYREDELIGTAHNIIRHPDMPRAAFRLVWDYLKQGRRVAALVKNLAHDGCYYWVVALFAPTPHGHLSVRFKPTSTWLATLASVYAAMLAEEERLLATGADPTAAMDASSKILLSAVNSHGYPDYDAFMRSLLCAELKSRDAALTGEQRTIVPILQCDERSESIAALCKLFRNGTGIYSALSRLFVRLDEFVALQESLESKATFVENLTRELRVAAMNASLASARVGSDGMSLGVVATHMGTTSTQVAQAVESLDSDIGYTSTQLKSVVFNLAAGRLQIEMILLFLHELAMRGITGNEAPATLRSIHALLDVFRHSLERAGSALGSLGQNNQRLNATAENLGRHMLELQVAQVAGVIEATRMRESGDFAAVFSHIRDLITNARDQLAQLAETREQLDAVVAETPSAAQSITASAFDMESQTKALVFA